MCVSGIGWLGFLVYKQTLFMVKGENSFRIELQKAKDKFSEESET